MGYNRSERVGDLIQVEVAGMLLHGELKDPRIGGFVTITRVMMSRDLKNAKILFSLMPTGAGDVPADKVEIADNTEGLNSAAPFIRRALAKRLDLKSIPNVRFIYDDSLEYASHLESVISKIHEHDHDTGNGNDNEEEDANK